MATRRVLRTALSARSLSSAFVSPQPLPHPFVTASRSVNTDSSSKTTHFGFETVAESEKADRVAGVFHSVADSYDRMNDLMSFGWHRVWKYVVSPPEGLPSPNFKPDH